MIVEVLGEFFSGVFKAILIAAAIILVIAVSATYYFAKDTNEKIHKVKNPVVPTVEINSKTTNGITISDTIYIYDFNEKK